LSLAACGPVSVYYKDGGSVARQKTDLLSCKVDALEKAPVANQIRQAPPYYVPGRRYCRPDGSCYYSGGFFAGGELYSVDVNAGLRRDLRRQCMALLGYRPVEVPRCGNGTVTAGTTLSTMPTLSPQSCAVRDSSGDWQIIDPAL
jgi:hypothetical protein